MIEQIKKPLRYIKRQLFGNNTNSQPASVLDCYSSEYPSSQLAINLFAEEWSSAFPAGMNLQAGPVALFEDQRIELGLAALGGVSDQTVLELGPLEGGHSYQLEKAGARSVLAIEANSRAYLKCLVAKEIMGMQKVQFLYGDFMAYLRQSPPRFDFVLCSGVLYHQKEPMELLQLLATVTDRVLLWTHYYDEAIIRSSPLSVKFPSSHVSQFGGFEHRLHRQEYQTSLASARFCGAGAEYSHWMERQPLLDALKHVGFNHVKVLQDDPHFVNGPGFLLAVSR